MVIELRYCNKLAHKATTDTCKSKRIARADADPIKTKRKRREVSSYAKSDFKEMDAFKQYLDTVQAIKRIILCRYCWRIPSDIVFKFLNSEFKNCEGLLLGNDTGQKPIILSLF